MKTENLKTEEKAVKKLEKMMEPYKSQFAWYLLVHLRSRCRVDPVLAAGILQEEKTYAGCYIYINNQMAKTGNWNIPDKDKFSMAEEYFRKPEKLMVDNKNSHQGEKKQESDLPAQKPAKKDRTDDIVSGKQMSLFDYISKGKINFSL
ncbi:MAG: PcfK-like family protein [Lachnospiraceae bacterium]|nr:PcfK-like family protein [Lachnospiraceae bacterium]